MYTCSLPARACWFTAVAGGPLCTSRPCPAPHPTPTSNTNTHTPPPLPPAPADGLLDRLRGHALVPRPRAVRLLLRQVLARHRHLVGAGAQGWRGVLGCDRPWPGLHPRRLLSAWPPPLRPVCLLAARGLKARPPAHPHPPHAQVHWLHLCGDPAGQAAVPGAQRGAPAGADHRPAGHAQPRGHRQGARGGRGAGRSCDAVGCTRWTSWARAGWAAGAVTLSHPPPAPCPDRRCATRKRGAS